MKSRPQRSLSFLAFSLFMGIGTYNAVVINSQSDLSGSDIRFVKRIDEVYGVTEPGRLVAAKPNWQKLPQETKKADLSKNIIVQEVQTIMAAPPAEVSEPTSAAAVQESLELNIVEAVNPKKWQQGLVAGQFKGMLKTEKGIIDRLEVSLPNDEGFSVEFAEMSGNSFKYDLPEGIFNAAIFQVDGGYKVVLNDGPLEGTHLKFAGEQLAQTEEREALEVASMGTNSETDSFGQSETEPSEVQAQEAPVEQAQVQPVENQLQPAEMPLPDQQMMEPQPLPEQQIVYNEQGQPMLINPQQMDNYDLQMQQQSLEGQTANLEAPAPVQIN